jgi:hypothetical protein
MDARLTIRQTIGIQAFNSFGASAAEDFAPDSAARTPFLCLSLR